VKRLVRLLTTPFGLAALGCVLLAGWALWSGGILDGPVARQVRSSSVYAAPGTGLDRAAAERVIGNRRLVVLLLGTGADLRAGCHSVRRAADGTLVLVMSRDGDGYRTYGCARLPGATGRTIGKAAAAETTIGEGVDGFADRPLEAMKVIAVNYDLLVKAGLVPDGARTISPSLPRYLIAAAAILAVLLGTVGVYAAGRRAGRLAAARRARSVAAGDQRSALSAAAGVLAQQIIDLDEQYSRPTIRKSRKQREYRQFTLDYFDLLGSAGTAGTAELTERIEQLSARGRALSGPGAAGPGRSPGSRTPPAPS
jgi:hypothetical protein